MAVDLTPPPGSRVDDQSPMDLSQQGFLASKRWTKLLPIAFITYSLAYLDRSNYSIAVAGGMKTDLDLTAGISALIGASFFLGYFFFQIPGAIYAERKSAVRLVFWCLILWGALASLQGLLYSATWLIIVRFGVGVVEAAVLPAMVILLANWFTARERGRANTFLILGNPITVMWLSAVSGYLIELTSWRGMFIIEGVPAILWAFVFRHIMRDKPRDAKWLAAREAEAVEAALEKEQAGLKPAGGYKKALLSSNVLLLCLQYFLWSLGIYGFVFWLPSIVSAGAKTGIGATGLISALPYALAVILMLLNSRASDRSGKRAQFVWPWLALGGVAFYGSYLVGTSNFALSFTLLAIAGACMYAPYGPYFAYIPEFLPRQAAAASIALINSCGALGGFAGSYLVGWLNSSTGSTDASFLLMAACLLVSAAIMPMVSRINRANAARDAVVGTVS
jgi:sugar phosphate permease